ncbi:MAG: glutamate-5-semialdehyde dehydrogenase [Planctomycetota bacterium]|nr:glutamate-5-semialdehyde dehydrogenase [Planctomycetota bacterium]
MSVSDSPLNEYCIETAQQAKQAAAELALCSTATRNQWLIDSAAALRGAEASILAANAADVDRAPDYGLSAAEVDRLVLNSERIESIAVALEEIALLPDPVGQTISTSLRPNGLQIDKVRVALGVVFFIYESRPNVTADAAAICVKSGNAVILRGGKEAAHSSKALVDVLLQVAQKVGIPEHAVQLVNTTDRDAVGFLLQQKDCIDVAIPRGGAGLIHRVVEEATMPVMKHFDGNCHVYVDQDANLEMAIEIIVNSKCQRMGVCNACESLVIHEAIASQILPMIATALEKNGILIHGDAATCELIDTAVQASEEDFSREYLGPEISIRVVENVGDAIKHINQYSSGHTEAIVTENKDSVKLFTQAVDSSAVMVNASTRFNDGGEFGLGAEIGISTDKFHARGPCGLQELTTYKYIATGSGQIRQ